MGNKSIYSVALLALLCACNNEDIPTPQPEEGAAITFEAPEVKLVESRTLVEGNTLTEGSFGVMGYCLANTSNGSGLDVVTGTAGWNSKKVLATPHLFYKQEVNHDGTYTATNTSSTGHEGEITGGKVLWYSATTASDAANYLYTFFAYYPYSDWTITPTSSSTVGEPRATYTLTANNINNAPDLMVASLIDTRRSVGSVKFKFQHLLSGLNLKVVNHSDQELSINSAKLTGNLHSTISVGLDLEPTISNSLTATLDYGSFSETSKTLLLLSNGDSFSSSGEITIALNYTLDGTTKNNPTTLTLPDFNPLPGIIYTLELIFTGDAFLLNAIVDNNSQWEDDGDSDITFQ